MLSTLIIFILILSLLVFVHEFGHFITAKKMGVRVEEFGLGFPPRLWKIKKGETIYSVNWIPLGGFVKLKGEDGTQKADKDSFAHKKIWQKVIILASGVTMNFVLAILVISLGFMLGFPKVIEEENLEKFATVKDVNIQIAGVLENTPAQEAGLQTGDIIKSIDQKNLASIEDIQNYIDKNGKENLVLEIKRGDEVIQKEIIPMAVNNKNDFSDHSYAIGVSLVKTGVVKYPFYIAFYKGIETTWFLIKEILNAFYGLFKNLLAHQKTNVEFTGPVGIAALTGKVASMGFLFVLQFIALLSINLGIINLIPFPALDGGRILFLIIEKFRGKAVDERIENMIHNFGFALLMVLVLFVTYKDILNYKDAFLNFFAKIGRIF